MSDSSVIAQLLSLASSADNSVSTVREPFRTRYGSDPVSAAENLIAECLESGISIITSSNELYPNLLREISSPPPFLFLKGTLTAKPCISIVGTRTSDLMSERITCEIASVLARSGFCVVSGMAKGIDRAAHRGALDADGATIGVLAGGIDSRYPASNKDIFERIAHSHESGLLAEFPPGIAPDAWSFARRNRIISALSAKTIVVKAPEKSGALITASYALQQNRDVLVCPWNAFDSASAGSNRLIREGASVIASLDDLYEELSIMLRPDNCAKRQIDDKTAQSEDEQFLLSLMNGEPRRSLDLMMRESSKAPGEFLMLLTDLEVKGVIMREGGFVVLQKSVH